MTIPPAVSAVWSPIVSFLHRARMLAWFLLGFNFGVFGAIDYLGAGYEPSAFGRYVSAFLVLVVLVGWIHEGDLRRGLRVRPAS